MTSTFHGADVDRLRATAQAMCEAAQELTATSLRLYAGLFSLTWNGQDAMRARMAWDNEHGPTLLSTARSLVEAGERLLAEADHQEQASAADRAGAPPPTSPPPGAVQESIRSTLAQELGSMRTLLAVLAPSQATVDRARGAISWGNRLLHANTLLTKLKVPAGVSGPLTTAGLANDLASFREARRAGDLDGQLRAGGAVVSTAVGLGNKAAGAVVATTWETTWQFRDRVFSGSRWEQNFVERNDAIADMIGPVAVPVGLGTFIVSGVETGWERLAEIRRARLAEAGEPRVRDW